MVVAAAARRVHSAQSSPDQAWTLMIVFQSVACW